MADPGSRPAAPRASKRRRTVNAACVGGGAVVAAGGWVLAQAHTGTSAGMVGWGAVAGGAVTVIAPLVFKDLEDRRVENKTREKLDETLSRLQAAQDRIRELEDLGRKLSAMSNRTVQSVAEFAERLAQVDRRLTGGVEYLAVAGVLEHVVAPAERGEVLPKLLFLEPDPTALRLWGRILSQDGWDVVPAADVGEATDLLAVRPAWVAIDYVLAVEGLPGLIAAVRDRVPGCRVAVLAPATGPLHDRAAGCDPDVLLDKPLRNLGVLLHALHDAGKAVAP
jgi:hypothetical protein